MPIDVIFWSLGRDVMIQIGNAEVVNSAEEKLLGAHTDSTLQVVTAFGLNLCKTFKSNV